MKVVVTGGRKFTDGQRIEVDLRALLSLGLRKVSQGGNGVPDHDTGPTDWHPTCSADALALYACGRLGIEAETYSVRPAVDGPWPAAGPRRNIRMLEAERPDLVLAYPDAKSRGTWRCIRAALARDLSVVLWTLGLAWRDVLAGAGPGLTWFADGDRFVIARPTVMSDERCAQIAAVLHDEGEVP